MTRYIRGSSHFVTSMTAPIASGWSDSRVGLSPTGKTPPLHGAHQVLPPDEELAAVFDASKKQRARQTSSLEPHRKQITKWFEDGVQGTTIHGALKRRHGFSGSYSSVRRFVQGLADTTPRMTTVLEFAAGDAAQVDFGQGPKITDTHTGEQFKTWFFIMTLAWSRHQYAELVRDQSVETWLGCHRRAFEHFGGVPARIIIDNPKCAITKACYYDPQVQRSYADYAEGYEFLISPWPIHRKKDALNRASNTPKTTSCRCASSAILLTPTHSSGNGSWWKRVTAFTAQPAHRR